MITNPRKKLQKTNELKSLHQSGVGIGIVLLVVSLLLATGIALTKFSGDNPDGNKQKVKLDAAGLLQQSAQLRHGLTLLNMSTDIDWSGVGRHGSGRLLVANSSESYSDTATYPIGPTGTDNQSITWSTGSYAGTFNRPTVYAWTAKTVSYAVCQAVNAALGFGAPVVATPGLGSATSQTLSGSPSSAYTVTPAMASSMDSALGSQATACIDSDNGQYRIVARLNN